MIANKRATRILEDRQVDVKLKLSALWIALMFLYIYADILGFYTPETLVGLLSGEAGGVQITETFLIVMAIWMAVPSIMVLLSLTLEARANRWANLIVGVISAVVLVATFFAGQISLRYAFHAAVEAVLIALIIWNAWKWPNAEG
jgi:hypothetical protein